MVLDWPAMGARQARHWRARALAWGVAVCAGAGCTSAHVERHEPRSSFAPEMDEARFSRAQRGCAVELQRQVSSGMREQGRCDAVTTRGLVRRGTRFGVVDYRAIKLTGATFRVSEARMCRGWPLPSTQGEVLRTRDAQLARCMLRPYRGDIAVSGLDKNGARRDVFTLHSDRDGFVRLEYSALDASLRDASRGGLDDYVALELGHEGWVGTVDLIALRRFLADWHFAWVSRGRGSAALFAKRHGAHPRRSDAETLAVQAQIQRQRRDFRAVSQGRMQPSSFLQRHVWSPFRDAVKAFLVENTTSI